MTDFQTAGRGRLGRTWEAPPGSALLCSVLLRPSRVSHLVVACVALAGRDAAREVAGVDADLKWPNDLLVGGRKLAGVLAEADVDQRAVVVGIGMNLTAAPPGAAMLGAGDRDEVLDALLAAIDRRYPDRWDEVASEYRSACATIGQAVRVELHDETFTGTAADVDDDGRLLVDVGVCLRTVSAGDVVHLR